MISPNANWVWISVPSVLSSEDIFLAIFLARAKVSSGISFASFTGVFGITIVWPFEIGFMSRTAIADLFSSSFLEGIWPETIAR